MPHGAPAASCEIANLLLGGDDRVLGGLGDAELEHLLGRDLDFGASRGIAAGARLLLLEDELAEAGTVKPSFCFAPS